jgi:hypothetical protein
MAANVDPLESALRRCCVAVAMLAEIPDLTTDQYEMVVKKVSETGTPAGAVFHAGGPVEGGYRVIEVWESREAAEAFYGSRLLREATATLTTQTRILMTWPVHGVDDGSGWRAVG